jgi:hypothetical protein
MSLWCGAQLNTETLLPITFAILVVKVDSRYLPLALTLQL